MLAHQGTDRNCRQRGGTFRNFFDMYPRILGTSMSQSLTFPGILVDGSLPCCPNSSRQDGVDAVSQAPQLLQDSGRGAGGSEILLAFWAPQTIGLYYTSCYRTPTRGSMILTAYHGGLGFALGFRGFCFLKMGSDIAQIPDTKRVERSGLHAIFCFRVP